MSSDETMLEKVKAVGISWARDEGMDVKENIEKMRSTRGSVSISEVRPRFLFPRFLFPSFLGTRVNVNPCFQLGGNSPICPKQRALPPSGAFEYTSSALDLINSTFCLINHYICGAKTSLLLPDFDTHSPRRTAKLGRRHG